jgi:hypothetical protein
LNGKSENKSVLGNEKRGIALSKINMMSSNHLFLETKQKKTENKSKDAPRKMYRI